MLVERGGLWRELCNELLLIVRRLQVAVMLGEGSNETGQLAELRFGAQMHLLDDGFQHRGLGRDFDIVLVTPEDVRDSLIPAGRLREPLRSLRRADAVVLASGASPEAFRRAGKTL